MKSRILAAYLLVGVVGFSLAQTAPSPFTSIGVGKLTNHGMIQHQGTGLGIGTGSYWTINNVNPALLVFSRGTIFSELTFFQTGILSETKNIKNETISERSNGSNMSYLTLAFPAIKDKWFTTLGLMPYSTVNYNLNYTYDVPGTENNANIKERGTGGFTQFYWSNGVTITKNLSLGLRSSFLFGPLISEYSSFITATDIPSDYVSTVYQRTNPSGFVFTGGIAYQDSIKRTGNKRPLKITIGAVYDFGRAIKAKQFETIQRRSLLDVTFESDTLENNSVGKLTMPSGFGLGASISEHFKWSLGIDAKLNNGSEYRAFGEELSNAVNGFTVVLGGTFTPDAFSTDEYFSRVTYRSGVSYEKAQFTVNGAMVNDLGINFGVSLPIMASKNAGLLLNKGFSSIDLAFRYGRQGSIDTNLLEEEYFTVHFGITFNDKWFVRRKFN